MNEDNNTYTHIQALPVLPYGGTSGHSGTVTSARRVAIADNSGGTREVQGRVLDILRAADTYGATIAEIREAVPEKHHGTLSGSLSCLHKAGVVDRLVETRKGCRVYVMPQCTNGRETEKQGRGPSEIDLLLAYWMDTFDPASRTGRTTSTRAERYPPLFARDIRKYWEAQQ